MSPVETWCHNINYYIPDEGNETKELSMEQMARIRKLIYMKICRNIMYTQGRHLPLNFGGAQKFFENQRGGEIFYCIFM